MPINVFVLGMPGSGKSTVARYMLEYAKLQYGNLPTQHVNDYDILYKMFRDYQKHETENSPELKQFIATEHDGFVVLDSGIYDQALRKLETEIKSLVLKQTRLIMIEFARIDYQKAFQQFSSAIIEDAYFLFLDVDVYRAIERVRKRVAHPATHDDHFVPDFTLEAYLYKDIKQYILSGLKNDYRLDGQKVKIIENNRSFEDIRHLIEQFTASLFSV